MRPLPKLVIRDFEAELEDRLSHLNGIKALAIVKSMKGNKVYGLGMSLPGKDLILRNMVRIWEMLMNTMPATATIISVLDINNVSYNLMAGAMSAYIWDYGTETLWGTQLGFGNPATAPTPARADYQIASPVARFDPSSTTIDEVNWRVITTGSYVWTAGGTVRCTGLYYNVRDTGQVFRTILIYYDAVADVVVPAGGTVSVTYTTQM